MKTAIEQETQHTIEDEIWELEETIRLVSDTVPETDPSLQKLEERLNAIQRTVKAVEELRAQSVLTQVEMIALALLQEKLREFTQSGDQDHGKLQLSSF